MEKDWQIEKTNLKYSVPLHILVCLILLALSPFLMGVSNLGPQDTAKALEMYVALTGIILMILLGGYILLLKNIHCEFPAVRYFLGTFAEMLFFRGLGFFCYGLCDNLIIGYMVPLMYYITAMGSGDKYLKIFYPFSMVTGSYKEKFVLFVTAVVLIAAGIALRCRKK